MSQFYKLTDENMQTFGGFQWELGKWVWAKGSLEQGLCSDGWIHGYEHPLLAVLFNSIHGCYEHLRMFDIDVAGLARYDGQVKCGFRGVRLAREIDVPHVTTRQRVAFGILCAKAVFKDETWSKWADNWPRGEDGDTYPSAAYAAYATGDRAADAAFDAAAYAADAAAAAASAFAHAAAADDAYARAAGAYAADAAAKAAHADDAANNAQPAVIDGATSVDLIRLAQEAMTY